MTPAITAASYHYDKGRIVGVMKLIFSAGLFLLASTPLSFSQPANLYTFSRDVDLGQSIGPFGSSGAHCIGTRGDTVYVIWSDGTIYCQKSTNGGNTFGLPVQVNSTPTGVHYGMKVDSGGIIYVAFQDFADIYFTKSIDGGQTFIPAVKVNDDTIPQIGQEKPAIAVNNKGQIFIAWRDQRTAPGEPHKAVFASASLDGGATFLPNVQVNDSTTPIGGGVDISADDERVYLVWEPNHSPFILSVSEDSGRTFPFRSTVGTVLSSVQSIAVENGLIGIAFQEIQIISDSLQFTLRFSFSNDYGQSFSHSTVIDNNAEPQSPSLVFKNGVFYVTWRGYYFQSSDSTWEDQVYFSYSPDMGQSFVPRAGVVQGNPVLRQQSGACLTVNDSGKAFVVWSDDRYDIYNDGQNIHLFLSAGVPNVVKGDLNMDGLVTLYDVVTELNAVFFGQPFPANFAAADQNCDLRLTATDMVLLLRMYYLSEYFAC